MKYISGTPREQASFLPESIEEYVGADSCVRVIDAFVDGLDLQKAGFRRAVNNTTGRPPYDPRDLLKLYIYGYMNSIRSSRRLARECERNVEVFFLLKKITPDFRTVSDFRKDNADAVKKVFSMFTRLCMKMGLLGETVAVDGTKIRAVNSKDNCYTPEVLRKKLSTVDDKIARYMAELDAADAEEKDTDADKAAVIRTLEELAARKGRYLEYLEELEKSGETQLLTTDPEARRMHSKDGFHCGFNVQSAVEDKSHMVVSYEVTGKNNDMGQLCGMASSAKEELDARVITAMADKGYDSREDILNCVMNGTIPQVIPKYDKDETVISIEYVENDISEEERLSSKPEDIQKCLHAGVLPAVYEGSGISVEQQLPENISCFIKNEDGTVTCPTGKILHKTRTRGENTIYASKEACRQCATRCKAGSSHKVVSFGPNTTYVPVKLYGAAKDILRIPGEGMSAYNHTLCRKDYIKPKTVLIRIRHDEGVTKQRKCLVEHPFGTVKRDIGAYYTLLKGKTKVSADMGLAFLAYNIKRAINIVGTQRLIEEMGR